MLTEKTRTAILELQKQYPHPRSALIPALHLAQDEKGYLPIEIQEEVATLFNLALTEVHAVVTFYDMFFEKPVGKHVVHVCKNLSCMLNGADEIVCELKKAGCTVIASECLAACDRAPMVLLDEEVIGPVGPKELERIIKEVSDG